MSWLRGRRRAGRGVASGTWPDGGAVGDDWPCRFPGNAVASGLRCCGPGSFSVPRMGLSPDLRVYLTTIISLAGVALATLCGVQAGRAAADRLWWTLGAVAASVTAAGVPAYEQIRKEQMRARAQQAAVDSAAHLAGSGRVRACLFRVTPGTPGMLVPDQYSGRVDDPLEPIAEGTAQGDLIFSMIRRNQHLFCPDVDASLPPGWQVIAPQTYQSFAAVPVAAGQDAFGMLM